MPSFCQFQIAFGGSNVAVCLVQRFEFQYFIENSFARYSMITEISPTSHYGVSEQIVCIIVHKILAAATLISFNLLVNYHSSMLW